MIDSVSMLCDILNCMCVYLRKIHVLSVIGYISPIELNICIHIDIVYLRRKQHYKITEKESGSQEIVQFNSDPNEDRCLIFLFLIATLSLNHANHFNHSFKVLFFIFIILLLFFFFVTESSPYSFSFKNKQSKYNILMNVNNAEYFRKIIPGIYINVLYLHHIF